MDVDRDAAAVSELSVWTYLALGSFLAVAFLALAAHWPASAFYASVDASELVDARREDREPVSIDELRSGVAVYLARAYELNERRIATLVACVRAASILVAFEVLWWVVELVSGA